MINQKILRNGSLYLFQHYCVGTEKDRREAVIFVRVLIRNQMVDLKDEAVFLKLFWNGNDLACIEEGKRKIEEDAEIVEELQDGNQTNTRTGAEDPSNHWHMQVCL